MSTKTKQLKNFIKVTQAQYDKLLAGGKVAGQVFDPNALYLIKKEEVKKKEEISGRVYQDTPFDPSIGSHSVLYIYCNEADAKESIFSQDAYHLSIDFADQKIEVIDVYRTDGRYIYDFDSDEYPNWNTYGDIFSWIDVKQENDDYIKFLWVSNDEQRFSGYKIFEDGIEAKNITSDEIKTKRITVTDLAILDSLETDSAVIGNMSVTGSATFSNTIQGNITNSDHALLADVATKANKANITTTANAIPKYSDTTGTFANTSLLIDSSNNIDMNKIGSIKNLSNTGGIYWNPYVESDTDNSDAGSIVMYKNVSLDGQTGTVLKITQQNDIGDTIQFVTNTSANLYHNTNKIWTAGNDGAGSGLDADLLDGKNSSDFVTVADVQTVTGTKTFNAATINSGSIGNLSVTGTASFANIINGNISGNAGSANKVNNNIKIQLNGGTTEGTNQFTYDGSAAKSLNITPAGIGAAEANHTHTQANIVSWIGLGTNQGDPTWGTLKTANGYTTRLHAAQAGGGAIVFAEKSNQTSMQIDGKYYQNEGQYVVLDSSDAKAEGNRASGTLVKASAAGQISSVSYILTTESTAKALLQYNATDDCIDFIFR